MLYNVTFSLHSNPTPEPVEGPLGNGPITWPKFIDDERNILIMKRDVESSVNYRVDENAFFLEYMSYLTQKPLMTKG